MDLLNIIREKAKSFGGTTAGEGVDAVIHHIDIAESHFNSAKSTGEYLYTDVIYRTNQAFEGVVKEAYRILAGGRPERKKPHEIEKYFETNDTLRSRVLAQFTTYRTEWRNKSTHDYQLFFSAQEALLAIASVTAFANILLDQMLETLAFETEKEKLEKAPDRSVRLANSYPTLSFRDQCIELLNSFSKELKIETDESIPSTEQELQGRVAGFISTLDPSVEVLTEYPINYASGKLNIDLLLRRGNEAIIVELKRPSLEYHRKALNAKEQLRHYLIASKLKHGIVYAPVLRATTKTEIEEYLVEVPDGRVDVVVLTPAVSNS